MCVQKAVHKVMKFNVFQWTIWPVSRRFQFRKRTTKKSAEVFFQIIKSKKIRSELLSVEGSQWRSENFASSEFNTLFCRDSCEWICWTDGYGKFYISGGHVVFHSNIFGV